MQILYDLPNYKHTHYVLHSKSIQYKATMLNSTINEEANLSSYSIPIELVQTNKDEEETVTKL